MKIKPLDHCQTERDFEDYAVSHGAVVTNGGNHRVVRANGYSIPLSNASHAHKQLHPESRHRIVRAFKLAGLGLLLCVPGGLIYLVIHTLATLAH